MTAQPMVPVPDAMIDELARRLRQRNDPSRFGGYDPRGPYVLFLGAGCARAAGVPSLAEIAREALRSFASDEARSEEADERWLHGWFARYTASMSQGQLARMLQSLFAAVAVPSFYQDLALLVRERRFPLIVTTSVDTLLEQALAGVGVRASDLRVTTFGERRVSSPESPWGASPPLTHLVKLHGDLAQNTAQLFADQIEAALSRSREWLKADLRSDMVMIGHQPGDDPVDEWLARTSHRELWWVAQNEPQDPAAVVSWAADEYRITGEVARPQVFFPQLVRRLLRAAPASEREAEAVPPGQKAEPPLPVDAPRSGGAAFADVLQEELLRSQAMLYTLDQQSPAGERPSHVEAQIGYQKQQIARIEDRLRSLPDVKPQMLGLVRKIGDDVAQAVTTSGVDPALGDVAPYLNSQLETLELELNKDAPNQLLVSAPAQSLARRYLWCWRRGAASSAAATTRACS